MKTQKWASEFEKIYKNVVLISDNQITLEIGEKILIPDLITNLVQNNAVLFEVKILDGLEEWFMTITDDKKNNEK